MAQSKIDKQTEKALSISNVPLFSRPMEAREDDIKIGEDELGNPRYRTMFGDTYTVSLAQDQRTTMAKVKQDVIPAVKEYIKDPTLPTVKQVADTGKAMAVGAYETASIPKKLFTGEMSAADVTVGDVSDIATGMALGSTAASVPDNALRMFGGAKAVSPKPKDKGFIGRDGVWRFEFADNESVIKPEKIAETYEAVIRTISSSLKKYPDNWRQLVDSVNLSVMSDVIDHPKLFDQYPELKNIPVVIDKKLEGTSTAGYITGNRNIIAVAPNQVKQGNERELRNTLLHEIQHIIQEKEGFDSGTSSSSLDVIKFYESEKNSPVAKKAWEDYSTKVTEINSSYVPRATEVNNRVYAYLLEKVAAIANIPVKELHKQGEEKGFRNLRRELLRTKNNPNIKFPRGSDPRFDAKQYIQEMEKKYIDQTQMYSVMDFDALEEASKLVNRVYNEKDPFEIVSLTVAGKNNITNGDKIPDELIDPDLYIDKTRGIVNRLITNISTPEDVAKYKHFFGSEPPKERIKPSRFADFIGLERIPDMPRYVSEDIGLYKNAMNVYRRRKGESEARNTERRADFNEEHRENIPYNITEDMAPEMQWGSADLETGSSKIDNQMSIAFAKPLDEDFVPQKTIKAYKLFKTDPKKPGELFPLFVDANTPVSQGVWSKAKAGELGDAGKVKSKIGPLAYRPGWHAGDLPVATHIGGKVDPTTGKRVADRKFAPNIREDNQVWAEVEIPADVDWQAVADARAKITKKGTPDPKTAHITDQLPSGGYYRYKTNSNMTGNWLISGEMKVNRVLDRSEVNAINEAAGVKDLPTLSELNKGYSKGGIIMDDYQYAEMMGNGYAVGGVVEYQTEMAFADGGLPVDPVSGNEVPPGSLPEEVRDDIPAQLSEGEYIVPADVLRYFGMKFFEDLRAEAKAALGGMEQDGRMGGEPIGEAPMEAEDDLPFSTEELQATEDTQMSKGGYMRGYAEAGLVTTPNEAAAAYPDTQMSSIFGGYGNTGGITYVTYYGPNGETITIQMFNGQPMSPIPSGYTSTPPAVASSVAPAGQVAAYEAPSVATTNNNDRDRNDDPPPAPLTEAERIQAGFDATQKRFSDIDFTNSKTLGAQLQDAFAVRLSNIKRGGDTGLGRFLGKVIQPIGAAEKLGNLAEGNAIIKQQVARGDINKKQADAMAKELEDALGDGIITNALTGWATGTKLDEDINALVAKQKADQMALAQKVGKESRAAEAAQAAQAAAQAAQAQAAASAASAGTKRERDNFNQVDKDRQATAKQLDKQGGSSAVGGGGVSSSTRSKLKDAGAYGSGNVTGGFAKGGLMTKKK